jgi:catechol 2,3-dioxygenase-like lactoylglutathione lyase family enzyme
VVKLSQTIPALPVRDAAAAVDFYRDRLAFQVLHHDGGFAVMARDDAVLHLWQAGDESWQERASLERPIRSGAESFIAGTASCRIVVDAVDDLYEELRGRGDDAAWQSRYTAFHTRATSRVRLTPSRGAGRDPRLDARASTSTEGLA